VLRHADFFNVKIYDFIRYGSKLRSEIQYSLMNFLILNLRKRELILFRTNFERSDREREIGIYSLAAQDENNIHK